MKDQFIEIFNDHIKRPGADALLAWLEKSDFFTAPASTRFHLSEPGGLVKHSVHVYERLRSFTVTSSPGTPTGPSSCPTRTRRRLPFAVCSTTSVKSDATSRSRRTRRPTIPKR